MKVTYTADDGTVFESETACRDYESFDQKAFGRFYNLTSKLLKHPETGPLYQAWCDNHLDLETTWRNRKILKVLSALMEEAEASGISLN